MVGSAAKIVAPGFIAKEAGGGVLGFGAGLATNMVTHGGWAGAGSSLVGAYMGSEDKEEEKRRREQQGGQGMWGKFMSMIG